MKNYSPNFWLLSLSSFLFFGSFNMVLPEFPAFMRSMGGGQYIGLHISLFTLTALISRPFSGKLTDTWGRLPVMIFGCLITALVSLIYPFFLNIYAFLVIRFIHGFSTGFKPTATAAYLTDILPKNKRGEGMGVFSFFGMIGMGIGNYVGGEIALRYTMDTLFYSSAGIAILSLITLAGMKETIPNKQKFSWKLLKIKKYDIYEPKVIVPSVVMILVTFSFGAILTLSPDISVHLGIENKGLFFSYFTITSLISRVIGGKLSDRFGRRKILMIALIIIGTGAFYVGWANNAYHLLVGALIFGAGYGFSSPAIFAWAADLTSDKFRGRGFSTVFMALEIGIGTGAFISGQFYRDNPDNIFSIFAGCGILAFLGFIYLIFKGK